MSWENCENVYLLTSFTYLLTYSMEQSPPWEANRSLASQKFPEFYRIRRFTRITAFTSTLQLPLSWAKELLASSYHSVCPSACTEQPGYHWTDFHETRYLGIFWKYHHHKHQGLHPLIRSVSRVTTALANVSSVFQLLSFPVVCGGMISKGFGFVAFFASVEASSVCIRLSCLICLWSVVRGLCSHLFCGHEGYSLPEVSVISFLPLQYYVFVRLLQSNFLTHIEKNSSFIKTCQE